jgi:hypothetical protein
MALPSHVSLAQRRTLARLSELPISDDLFLAGGVAVAWYFDHRTSRDLDLFSRSASFDLERASAVIEESFGRSYEVVGRSDVTLHVVVGGIDVDIVRYRYPSLSLSRGRACGIRLASIRDLAVMKLSAIATRGIRRDFWDLAVILQSKRVTLASALADYSKKFGVGEADRYHVLRALTWFADAERDRVLPRGMTQKHWRELKSYFVGEVQRASAFGSER